MLDSLDVRAGSFAAEGVGRRAPLVVDPVGRCSATTPRHLPTGGYPASPHHSSVNAPIAFAVGTSDARSSHSSAAWPLPPFAP